jgi:hypothetical protein
MIEATAFRDLVVRRRDACVKFKDGKPSRDRREAMDFYNGKNLDLYGDSGDGLSTVVSRDVMESIESVMPPLLRPFVAGEEVVSFDPVQAEDEEGTKQATEYVNHVFKRGNNVLDVAQTALKDGLLFRLGVAKTVMEEEEDGGPEQFSDLDEAQLMALRASAQEQGRELVGDIAQDPSTGLYSATLGPKKRKCYRVHIIAPDEFLYEERLASLNASTFLGHSKVVALGDLIAMGLDEEKCRALKSGKPSEEQDARFPDEDDNGDDWKTDDLARPVWVDECYIRCDYQGEGVLEWRKVMLGGQDKTLILDEAAEDHPYSTWTPIPIPHKLVGLSYFDLTREIQINKTAIQRELNNAMYLANRPMRAVLKGKADIDALLNPSVGGIVQISEKGAVENIPSGGDAAFGPGLQMIEYMDGMREARTGVTRYNQGMDSNSLNKTATGMNIISSNSQQRQELVARQFGEFLKDIFLKLLGLVSQHASEQDVAKLRGQFVPWPTEYDANVSVGLGTNNKDQLVGHLMSLMQLDERIIGLQQGLNGPLLTAVNVYEKLKRVTEAMGLKGDKYYTNPEDMEAQPQQQQEPPQDPLAEPKLKAQTEIEKENIRQQGKVAVEQMRQQSSVVPFEAVG